MSNSSRSKQVALVSAHFPPSHLAGVHRARLWAQYLPEFGWTPIVVTTQERHTKSGGSDPGPSYRMA